MEALLTAVMVGRGLLADNNDSVEFRFAVL